ncbi:MAG: hypothetical protein II797_01535, partial [Clostridia bacterium]|nr:hypothetical protein [Clostridia bacterium]
MSTNHSVSFRSLSVLLAVLMAVFSFPLSVFAMQNAGFSIDAPVEVEDKRDGYSKTYLNPDGTYTSVMYADPVHENTSGTWKDIDNTLKYNGKTERYETSLNPSFSVSFSKKANEDALVSMLSSFENGLTLSWTLGLINNNEILYPNNASFKSVNPETNPDEDPDYHYPSKVTSYVSYENAFEGNSADIRYTVSQNKVKEELVFHAPSDISSVVSVFSCENLTAV